MEQTEIEWINQEAKKLQEKIKTFETIPALKLEENKIAEITIDFSKAFETWIDPETKKEKAIIPVTCKGEKLVWWLNKQNPVYMKIMVLAVKGQRNFKVLQTGNKQTARYTIVE